jgi:hypothetical protein
MSDNLRREGIPEDLSSEHGSKSEESGDIMEGVEEIVEVSTGSDLELGVSERVAADLPRIAGERPTARDSESTLEPSASEVAEEKHSDEPIAEIVSPEDLDAVVSEIEPHEQPGSDSSSASGADSWITIEVPRAEAAGEDEPDDEILVSAGDSDLELGVSESESVERPRADSDRPSDEDSAVTVATPPEKASSRKRSDVEVISRKKPEADRAGDARAAQDAAVDERPAGTEPVASEEPEPVKRAPSAIEAPESVSAPVSLAGGAELGKPGRAPGHWLFATVLSALMLLVGLSLGVGYGWMAGNQARQNQAEAERERDMAVKDRQDAVAQKQIAEKEHDEAHADKARAEEVAQAAVAARRKAEDNSQEAMVARTRAEEAAQAALAARTKAEQVAQTEIAARMKAEQVAQTEIAARTKAEQVAQTEIAARTKAETAAADATNQNRELSRLLASRFAGAPSISPVETFERYANLPPLERSLGVAQLATRQAVQLTQTGDKPAAIEFLAKALEEAVLAEEAATKGDTLDSRLEAVYLQGRIHELEGRHEDALAKYRLGADLAEAKSGWNGRFTSAIVRVEIAKLDAVAVPPNRRQSRSAPALRSIWTAYIAIATPLGRQAITSQVLATEMDNPERLLRGLVNDAQAAVDASQGAPHAWLSLAQARNRLAEHLGRTGQDPIPAYRQAQLDLDRAIQAYRTAKQPVDDLEGELLLRLNEELSRAVSAMLSFDSTERLESALQEARALRAAEQEWAEWASFAEPLVSVRLPADRWSNDVARQETKAWMDSTAEQLREQFAHISDAERLIAEARADRDRVRNLEKDWAEFAAGLAELVHYDGSLPEDLERWRADPATLEVIVRWQEQLRAIISSLQLILDSNSQVSERMQAQMYYGDGLHFFFAGQMERAREKFDQAIQTCPYDGRFFYFRAMASICSEPRGDLESAIQDIRTGSALERRLSPRTDMVNRSLERVQGDLRAWLDWHRADLKHAQPPLPTRPGRRPSSTSTSGLVFLECGASR